MRKRNSNKRGVVLYTVVIVSMIAMLLISAIIGFVKVNITETQTAFKQQQAYMTASTCLESFINEIQSVTNTASTEADAIAAKEDMINMLNELASANAGKGTESTSIKINGNEFSTANMGDCTLKVAKESAGSSNIVITATCEYAGVTQTVAAHITTGVGEDPVDYTNAIEITGAGSASYDNLNVIGDMSTINNSATAVYTMTNNSTIYGSYFLYGTLETTTQFTIDMRPSLVDAKNNGSVTVSNSLNVNSNYATFTSIMSKTSNNNYLNVGNALTVTGGGKVSVGVPKDTGVTDTDIAGHNPVDVYCGSLHIGSGANNQYKQYGDLYVCKSDGASSGDLILDSGCEIIINGNAYVEGKLSVNTTKITCYNGKIYCNDVEFLNGKTLADYPMIELSSTPQTYSTSRPTIPEKSDFYKYDAEYLLCKPITNNGKTFTSLSEIYNNFYATDSSAITDTLWTIFTEQSNNGTKGNIHASGTRSDGTDVDAIFFMNIDRSCTIDASMITEDLGEDYKTAKRKILITVKDEDIVIRLKDMTIDKTMLFVVKNDSTDEDPHYCYFVSDSGIDGKSDLVEGTFKNTHKPDGGETKFNKVNVSFTQSVGILDFDTYIDMFTVDEIENNASFNGFNNMDSSFILNPTASTFTNDTGNTYSHPNLSRINVIFTEGCTFSATNNCLFQCEFYCPDANVEIATQGQSLRTTDANGNIQSLPICNIGMVVASNFGNANTAFYVFNKPDTTGGIWSVIKDLESTEVQGFKLQRYDHY